MDMTCSVYQRAHGDNSLHSISQTLEIVEKITLTGYGNISDSFRLINHRDFKTWYKEIGTGTALVYKYHPPEIRQDSKRSITSFKNSLSDPGQLEDLQEFCPVYNKRIPSIGHNELSNAFKITPNDWSSEAVWCASAVSRKERQSAKTSPCNSDNNLVVACREKYKIGDFRRGKWILKEGLSKKSLSINVCWKKLCFQIKRGEFPHCNARLQLEAKEIWIYCDFFNCMEIFHATCQCLPGIETMSFHVHPHGAVISL
ncbi:shieldin complex subunit 3 isoform X2 [Nematostella vectensis]|uniref:shieldin complex subunit 3 isoform X2 n=1 Tax=Nematostella vectensis TaxID=45351 RepID=UPI002077494D|nr:shieldin complex subunit 3 isoform X2 [Nematostella vectensis]